jgi:hypothetical protein
MYLTTKVFDNCGAPNIDLRREGLLSPGVRVLCFFEFRDKLVKCGVPVTDAGAVPKHRVKTGGLTIIVQSDLLIALNRTGTYCKVQ